MIRLSVVRPKLVSKKWMSGRQISRNSIEEMINVSGLLLSGDAHYAFTIPSLSAARPVDW